MSITDYKTEAKKVLDLLPDDKVKIAFNLLEHLRGLDSSSASEPDIAHEWLKCFTDEEKEEMLEEILESIMAASSSGNWSVVHEVVGAWEETSEILSDEHLMAEIMEAEKESQSGEIVSWESVKEKLSLG